MDEDMVPAADPVRSGPVTPAGSPSVSPGPDASYAAASEAPVTTTEPPEAPTEYLRALSFKQPFCSAFVMQKRSQESRTWKIKLPDDGSGLWVAAHAPAKVVPKDSALLVELKPVWSDMPSFDKLPRSGIVGFLHLASCGPLEDVPEERREPGCVGPFVWTFDRAIPLPQLFPCSGALGMWTPPRELLPHVPEEVLTHCQSAAVLALVPPPRKPSAKATTAVPRPDVGDDAQAALGVGAGASGGGSAKRKRASTEAATIDGGVGAVGGASSLKGGDTAAAAAAAAAASAAVGRDEPKRTSGALGELRVLKVKLVGEKYYREVRLALPASYAALQGPAP